jgi:hypothetical protein
VSMFGRFWDKVLTDGKDAAKGNTEGLAGMESNWRPAIDTVSKGKAARWSFSQVIRWRSWQVKLEIKAQMTTLT